MQFVLVRFVVDEVLWFGLVPVQSGIAAACYLPESPEMALQRRGCESGNMTLAPDHNNALSK